MQMIRKRPFHRRGFYGNPIGLILFLLPGIGAYTLIMLYPLVMSFVYSMINWQGLKPLWTWNNFKYFKLMFADPVIWSGLANNGRAWLMFALVQVPLALLLAFFLSRKIRAAGLFRFIYYIPQVTSVLLLAMIFKFLLSSEYGVNALLKGIGLGALAHPWLSANGLVQWVVMVPQTWAGVGFWVVIFLAAILGVPEDLLEAAQLDGANDFQLLYHVTLPSIGSVVQFSYVMTVIMSLQALLYQFLLPTVPGGPADLTHTLGSYLAVQVINEGRVPTNWGYGSAIAVLLFFLSVLGTLLVLNFNRLSRKAQGE